MKRSPITEHIKVSTSNHKVGKRYFSFDYELKRNGVTIDKGHYSNSHSRAPQTIRRYLKSGYATELILQKEF